MKKDEFLTLYKYFLNYNKLNVQRTNKIITTSYTNITLYFEKKLKINDHSCLDYFQRSKKIMTDVHNYYRQKIKNLFKN